MKNLKCLIGLHNYEVYKEEELVDFRGNSIGKVFINRCKECGKLKIIKVITVENY